jgi:hypothetical protein
VKEGENTRYNVHYTTPHDMFDKKSLENAFSVGNVISVASSAITFMRTNELVNQVNSLAAEVERLKALIAGSTGNGEATKALMPPPINEASMTGMAMLMPPTPQYHGPGDTNSMFNGAANDGSRQHLTPRPMEDHHSRAQYASGYPPHPYQAHDHRSEPMNTAHHQKQPTPQPHLRHHTPQQYHGHGGEANPVHQQQMFTEGAGITMAPYRGDAYTPGAMSSSASSYAHSLMEEDQVPFMRRSVGRRQQYNGSDRHIQHEYNNATTLAPGRAMPSSRSSIVMDHQQLYRAGSQVSFYDKHQHRNVPESVASPRSSTSRADPVGLSTRDVDDWLERGSNALQSKVDSDMHMPWTNSSETSATSTQPLPGHNAPIARTPISLLAATPQVVEEPRELPRSNNTFSFAAFTSETPSSTGGNVESSEGGGLFNDLLSLRDTAPRKFSAVKLGAAVKEPATMEQQNNLVNTSTQNGSLFNDLLSLHESTQRKFSAINLGGGAATASHSPEKVSTNVPVVAASSPLKRPSPSVAESSYSDADELSEEEDERADLDEDADSVITLDEHSNHSAVEEIQPRTSVVETPPVLQLNNEIQPQTSVVETTPVLQLNNTSMEDGVPTEAEKMDVTPVAASPPRVPATTPVVEIPIAVAPVEKPRTASNKGGSNSNERKERLTLTLGSNGIADLSRFAVQPKKEASTAGESGPKRKRRKAAVGKKAQK